MYIKLFRSSVYLNFTVLFSGRFVRIAIKLGLVVHKIEFETNLQYMSLFCCSLF